MNDRKSKKLAWYETSEGKIHLGDMFKFVDEQKEKPEKVCIISGINQVSWRTKKSNKLKMVHEISYYIMNSGVEVTLTALRFQKLIMEKSGKVISL